MSWPAIYKSGENAFLRRGSINIFGSFDSAPLIVVVFESSTRFAQDDIT